MCQARSEGGRRCAIHQHQNIAAIRAASHVSGLSKQHTERLFAELRREGRVAEPTNEAAHNASIQRIRESVAGTPVAGTVNTDLERSKEHDPEIDPASAYAQAVLLQRAKDRQANLDKRFKEVAEKTGYSTQEVAAKYKDFCDEVDTRRGVDAPPEYTPRTRRAAVLANLPYDQASVTALVKLENMQPLEEGKRRITTFVSGDGRHIDSMGYDKGRLELVFSNFPNEIRAYCNVPEEAWNEIKTSPRPYRSFLQNVRGREEYMYATEEAAERDAFNIRCAACGQFRSSGHSCPERELRARLSSTQMTAAEVIEEVNSPTQKTPQQISEEETEAAVKALYTANLAVRQDVTIVAPVGEEPYVSFGESFHRRAFTTTVDTFMNVAAKERIFIPAHLNQNMSELTHEEISVRMRYRNLTTHMTVKAPAFDGDQHDVIQKSDMVIPVEVNFKNAGSSYDAPAGNVTGSIRYKKADDIKSTEAVSTDLKCDCYEYSQNYDCEHIRVVKDQHLVILGAETDTKVDAAQSMVEYTFRNRIEVNHHRLMQSEMDRSGLGYDDAVIARKQRIAQETLDERNAALEQAKRRGMLLKADSEYYKETNEAASKEYESYREKMLQRWETVEEPYTENPKAFYDDYKSALSRKRAKKEPLPFRTENVTDGICADEPGARSFGVELEFDIADGVNRYEALDKIGQELYAAGLTNTAEQQEYHTAADNGWGSWSFEDDCTVSGELVSPLMKDTPEHWEQLRLATEIITRNGGIATERTGSHVHVSTGSYEFSTAKHAELLRTVNDNEDLMYRLATSPKTGIHRRGEWCQPNENDEGADFISPEIEAGHHVLGFHTEHAYALNFEGSSSLNYRKAHTEFRMWDGTLDPAVIQQQVMLSAALTDHAERNVIKGKGSRKPKAEDRKIIGNGKEKDAEVLEKASRKSHSEATFKESNTEAAQFLDKLFRRREDRAAAASLFAVTTWQE
jgi:hypothetical protein